MASEAWKILTSFRGSTSQVQGWLDDMDCFVFHALLNFQSKNFITGDLLEIGVYQGKSAILLGLHLQDIEKLHVCDIFDNQTDEANEKEIKKSYPQFSLSMFLKNYTNVISTPPNVYSCASSELAKLLPDADFRFIHIDGSHLYQHVSQDLALAATLLASGQGIVVVDDFRAEHAIGVSCAMWEIITEHGLKPLIFTKSKAYLVPPNSSLTTLIVSQVLDEHSIDYELVGFKEYGALRVLKLNNPLRKPSKELVKILIPPFMITMFRAIKRVNFTW